MGISHKTRNRLATEAESTPWERAVRHARAIRTLYYKNSSADICIGL